MNMNVKKVEKLMERKKNHTKGEAGRVLIIGGSDNYAGAIALAGLAALRAGCDTVTIAAPEKVAWAVNCIAPDIMTKKFSGSFFKLIHAKEIIKLVERYDVILIGPGLGVRDTTMKFVKKVILKTHHKIKVVDADALKAISLNDVRNAVLTPHQKEMEVLLEKTGKHFVLQRIKSANIKEVAQTLQANLRFSLDNGNVLLVKGNKDMVISKNKIDINRTGNPGMAKAGTGDILAGMIAGFLAQTGDMFKSASAAAFINGSVGDLLLKKKKGYSFIASEIVNDAAMIKSLITKLKRSKRL